MRQASSRRSALKSPMLAMLAAALTFGSAAVRAEDTSFVLHNHTGVDVKFLYLSPAQSDDWQDDVLAGYPMLDGEDADISVDRGSLVSKWDLKLVDREGTSMVWPALDLSKGSDFTLRLNRGKPIVIVGDAEEE